MENRLMWLHSCIVEGMHSVGKKERCNWCGMKEEDESDPKTISYLRKLSAFRNRLADLATKR